MQTEQTAVDSLHTEVDIYRQNRIVLEGEIRTLIEENHRLAHDNEALKQQRAELVSRAEEHKLAQDDLQYKISFLIKERDSLLQLWQTSQRTVEALETELKAYHNEYTQGDSRKQLNGRIEDELKFNSALEQITALESQLEEATTKGKAIANELKAEEEIVKNYQEREKALEQKINEILKNLEEYKGRLDSESRNNSDLVRLIESTKEEINLSAKREAEAKSKVEEALQLLDIVTAQKLEACAASFRASEELAFLRSTISDATNEIESRLRAELEQVKEKYDEKISDMLTHIQTLDAELVEKGLLLSKTLRENEVLRQTNGILEKQRADMASSVDPSLAIANQKIEAVFQELILSERRNIRLVSEKQGLVIDAQRQHDTHAREIKRRDWEHQLQSTEIMDAKLQIEHLQKSLEESDAMVGKLQSLLNSKKHLIQKEASSKEDEVTELNVHIQKQVELNKKWRQSYMDMTEKLKKRLEELQEENNHLKAQHVPAKSVRHKELEILQNRDRETLDINYVHS